MVRSVPLLLALGACRPQSPSLEPGINEHAPHDDDEEIAEPWLFIEQEDPGVAASEQGVPGGIPTGPDEDGDSVPDDLDSCPSHPEDFDGFEDTDGCPEPDNDQDGILDIDDKCPSEPETFDGRNDEDGCPG